MDRIFESGAAVTPPAVPASPSAGYATGGNPGSAVPATKPGPWWYHMVTEELRRVIVDAGIAPDHEEVNQLSLAIQSLAGGLAKIHGQCRLSKSGSNLVLSPFNGNKLLIDGVVQTIPAAGVSLAPAGLVAGTLYYIYAYMSGGSMALEASATGHSTDATTGVEIKTGAATRTLVGMARPIAGPAFVDSGSQRFVMSWFNRQRKVSFKQAGSTLSTASATLVELSSSFRAEFLSWGDDVEIGCVGAVGVSGAGSYTIETAFGVDGTSIAYNSNIPAAVSASGVSNSIGGSTGLVVTEGYHYANVFAKTSGSTMNLFSSSDIAASVLG